MYYIFIDESGDLGFNFKRKGTSRFFIVTAVKVSDTGRKPLEKIVRTIFSRTRSKYNRTGIIHATEERSSVRKKLLGKLNMVDCEIICAIADKYTIRKESAKSIDVYFLLTKTILEKISELSKGSEYSITYILSRRETSRNKNDLLRYRLQTLAPSAIRTIRIEIKRPSEEKGLQVADFVSWAIFSMLNGNNSYYVIIQNKIICMIRPDLK